MVEHQPSEPLVEFALDNAFYQVFQPTPVARLALAEVGVKPVNPGNIPMPSSPGTLLYRSDLLARAGLSQAPVA